MISYVESKSTELLEAEKIMVSRGMGAGGRKWEMLIKV